MSDERGETVDLAYIGRALQRLTGDVSSLKDDMRVLTAIVLRHENMLGRIEENLRDMTRQITAMVAQHSRMADRLGGIEDRLDAIDGRIATVEARADAPGRGPG